MNSEEICLEKRLNIQYIHPDFKDDLLIGFEKYKDNAKIHKSKAIERRAKRGNNRKLKKEHLDFI